MDPYLEGDLWTSFHVDLAVEISHQLVPRLRPRYVALREKRFLMAMPDPEDDVAISTVGSPGAIYPDAAVVTLAPRAATQRQPGTASAAPMLLATVMPESVPQISIEIRDVANRQLVAAIEILSPTNKRPGDGRDEYLEKRRRVLISSAHLMEIDLLRKGSRVPMRSPLPASPYFVLLSRHERRPLCEVWKIALADSLPTVPVPLLPGDADVTLDLQQAVTNVYDLGGYDLLLNYAAAPEVPLSDGDATWADQHLHAAGKR